MTTSEEYVVLVDEQNNELGTALKSEVHTADTPLHRAFSCFIFNSKGELLLQQRAKSKKTWPGVWSNSCCGHPGPGEATEDAVRRRLQAELSIAVDKLTEILPEYRYRAELNGIVENEICPVYVGFTDKEIQPNPTEVEAIRWQRWEEFIRTVDSAKPPYSPWCIEETHLLADDPLLKMLLQEHTQTE